MFGFPKKDKKEKKVEFIPTQEQINSLKLFTYNKDPYRTKVFVHNDDEYKCDVCGTVPTFIYAGPAYCNGDIKRICAPCIASGDAAKKLNATFFDPDACDKVSNPEKLEELITKNPGYFAIYNEKWLAHCDDYCEFLGCLDFDEMDKLGITEKVSMLLEDNEYGYTLKEIKKGMAKGIIKLCVFRCLNCGTILVDMNM